MRLLKVRVLFDGVNILELEVDERARMGLFLAMQYPSEIPGITNAEFLRAAMNAGKEDDEKISVREFITKLDEKNGIAQHERRNGRALPKRRLLWW